MLGTLEYDKLFLICFTLVSLALVAGATVVGVQAARNGGASTAGLFRLISRNETGVRMITVLAVVSAALALSIAGTLTDGVVALLSSIAGYVLGGLRSQDAPDGGGTGAP